MKKNVLITGCAGFLGSHLCDYFLSKKYKVIGIDNLITGSLKNLSHLSSNSNFKFKKGDNIIFASFGAGFTWVAMFLKWAYNN